MSPIHGATWYQTLNSVPNARAELDSFKPAISPHPDLGMPLWERCEGLHQIKDSHR